jgi:hypothetical protein
MKAGMCFDGSQIPPEGTLADDSEVLLKFYDEDWRQVRQSEDQRTAFSNITLLIASAVFG